MIKNEYTEKIYQGKPLNVIEDLKEEIIRLVKLIDFGNKDFNDFEFNSIDIEIRTSLEFIHNIYRDILGKKINYNSEIVSQLITNEPYEYYTYDIISKGEDKND